MTDLLARPSRPARPQGRLAGTPAGPGGGSRRPLALGAAWAGIAAPLLALGLFWVVALLGWFASDGGTHGTTRSALQVGANAWLLAHGAHLTVGVTVITAIPLGLTALAAWAVFRAGRWAGRGSDVEDLASLGLGTVVLAGTYACVALVAAVLASGPGASADPLLAFLGGFALSGLAGGLGMVSGAGLRPELRALLPTHARAVLFGGLVGTLGLLAAGAALAAGAVAVRGQAVANVLAGLQVDGAGAAFSVGLVAALLPNLASWASSYLLGAGFTVGTGTVVAPSGVVLGPVPAVPVLAAVPGNGPAPGWVLAVVAVPVLCGLYAGHATARRFPTRSYAVGCARAAGAGALAALATTVLAALAGGAVGAGRMTDLGPRVGATFLLALVTLGLGAATAGALHVWWRRRHVDADDEQPLGPLDRSLPWRDRDAAAGRADERATRRRARRARRRGVGEDDPRADVPGWADLGVWGAATRHAPARPRSGDGPDEEHDGEPDGERTVHVPKPD